MSNHRLQIHSKVKFQEIKPRIIENVILENVELNVQDFYEMAEVNGKLSNNKPICILLEFEPFASVSKEYLEIAKSYGKTDGLIATALIAKNLAHKLAGNVYLKINKPANLTKMFTNKTQAVEWLLEQQDLYYGLQVSA